VPSVVAPMLARFARRVFVYNTENLEVAIRHSIAMDLEVLRVTPVIVIFKGKDGGLICRSYGAHSEPYLLRGVRYLWCGHCKATPGTVYFEMASHSRNHAIFCCTECKWYSKWLKLSEMTWAKSIGPTYPCVFYHDFPLSPALRMKYLSGWTAEKPVVVQSRPVKRSRPSSPTGSMHSDSVTQ
jgi:hypothetical protein